MRDFLVELFSGAGFTAKWRCGNWSDSLGYLHIVSDIAIFLAYLAIPIAMVVLRCRRRVGLTFPALYWLVAAFVITCGICHLNEAVMFWHPYYRFAGLTKLATALVSGAAVVGLVIGFPRMLALRSPVELEAEVQARTSELAKTKAQFEALYNDALDMLATVESEDGKILCCNATLAQVLGRSRAELEGSALRSLCAPECTSDVREGLRRLRAGEAINIGLELVGAGGRAVSVQWVARPAASGTSVSCVFRDVSEQEATKRALAQSERLYQAAFDHAPVGIAHVSLDGGWIRVNECMCDLLGYDQATLRTMTFQQITLEDDLEPGVEFVRAAVEGKVERFRKEKRYIRGDGRLLWADLTCSVVRSETGEALYFVSVVQDIGDRKRLEVERHERGLELEEANEELRWFASSVSHDLRAPVRAIEGFTRILAEDRLCQLDEEGRRILGVVRHNVLKMDRLIVGLLELARLGRRAITTTQLDMSALAREAVEVAIDAEKHGPTMAVEIGDLPPAIADEMLVRQVWGNLVGNAVKYTCGSDAPSLEIGGETRGAEVVYWVSDNGVGFESEYAALAFQPFRRLHPTDQFDGLGLGLAIAYRAVAKHGGRLWAEASPGNGATFFFALPLEERRH